MIFEVLLILLLVPIFTQNRDNLKPLRCGFKRKEETSKYFISATCSKSNSEVLISRNLPSLKSCIQLAIRKKAFALNFVFKGSLHESVSNFSENACLIYDCPDFDLMNRQDAIGSPYDYYSIYANTSFVNISTTCIGGIGIFHILKEKLTYHENNMRCHALGGRLADVMSETKTLALRQMSLKFSLTEAFIGLDQLAGIPHEFVTSKGVILNCENWRAWGSGEPKSNKGPSCGAISPRKGWLALPCETKIPAICEILPTGPIRPCQSIKKRGMRKKCIKKYKKSLPGKKRYPKCGSLKH